MFALFLKTALWIFIAILSGRIFGFVREILIAKQFGVSAQADTAALMTLAPDFFTNLVLGTALAGSFIPIFNRLKSSEQYDFYKTVATKTLLLGLFLWLIGALLAPLITSSFAGSLKGTERTQAIWLLRFDLAVIPLTLLSGIFITHLQARLKQIAPAYATFVFNLVLVLGLLYFVSSPQQWVWCILAAALIRLIFVWLLNSESQAWLSFKPNKHWKPFLNTYTTVWLGSALFLTLIPLIARAIASQLGEGELALFTYAQKLIELPNGLLISVIGVTLLPQLSKLYNSESTTASNDTRAFKQLTNRALLFTLALAYSVCFALIAVSFAYSEIVFGLFGKLDTPSIEKLSTLVFIGVCAIPAQGIIAVGNAALLSQNKAKLMLVINTASVLLFALLISGFAIIDVLTRNSIMLSWLISSFLAALLMLQKLAKQSIVTLKTNTLAHTGFITLGLITYFAIKSMPTISAFNINTSVMQFIQAVAIGMLLLILNFICAFTVTKAANRR